MIINEIKIFFTFLILLMISTAASAYDVDEYEKNITALEKSQKKLKTNRFTREDLSLWTRLAIDIKSTSELCVSEQQEVLVVFNDSLKGLGEAAKGEDKNVTNTRKNLVKDKAKSENIIADCKANILYVGDVEALLNSAKTHNFDKKYLSRQKNIVALLGDFLDKPEDLFSDSTDFFMEHSGLKNMTFVEWSTGLIVFILSLFLSMRIRSLLQKKSKLSHWNENLDNLLLHSAITTSARYIPHVLTSLSAYLFLYYINYGLDNSLFVTQFAFIVFVYFSFVSITSLFFSPIEPAKPILKNMRDVLMKISHRLNVLFLITLLGYLAFYTVFSESLTSTNLQLLRYVFSLFVVINLIWTIRVLINHKKIPKISWISKFVNLALMLTLLAEWMGYVNLSTTVRRGILISFVLIIAFYGVSKALQMVFNSLNQGSSSLSKRIRKKMGIENEAIMPGLIWIRITLAIVLWGSLFVMLVNIWDYNGGLLALLKSYLINGFNIGDFHIVPGRMLWALIVFSTLLMVTGWVKSQLDKHWLTLLNIEAGAQNAMVTVAGYIMFLMSVLIGLSVAGFNFGNIAIIAGALSVGIGFGLQNIVNNFVSGLILLFERPIRKGDWVEVGATEGFVKNIQIRSTLIRTFDNSDVIVPNSELISSQVTNWMLSSKKGRAIVPIGVAYGSDIEQVRDVLLNVAAENENLIHGDSEWEPAVLFREFGDSSLNFELRVFLKEVSGRLSVISELNFAIDKAFRVANIEIPFPQRDVHVKGLSDKYQQTVEKND